MESDSGDIESSFAERLRQVVKAHGTTSSLAAAIGRSEGAVRNWLTGRTEPTVSNLVAICQATGTTIDWLVTGQGPRGAQQSFELREVRGEYLHDAPARDARAPLDAGLLEAISQVIERELSERQATLAPDKKAALLVESYRFLGSLEKFDADTVVRLLKLAS